MKLYCFSGAHRTNVFFFQFCSDHARVKYQLEATPWRQHSKHSQMLTHLPGRNLSVLWCSRCCRSTIYHLWWAPRRHAVYLCDHSTSRCHQCAITMPSVCHHDAISVPSRCHQCAITMPTVCHHDAISLTSRCHQFDITLLFV